MKTRLFLIVVGVCLVGALCVLVWQLGQTSPTGPGSDPDVGAVVEPSEPAGATATTFGELRLPGGFTELGKPEQRENAYATVAVGAWRTKSTGGDVVTSLLEKNSQWQWKQRSRDDVTTLTTPLLAPAGQTRTLEVAVLESEAAAGTLVRAVTTTYLTGEEAPGEASVD